MTPPKNTGLGSHTKVVIATTIMLSFISFWRVAAIVLTDLASSAFYVGGISEKAIGKTAPWFVLAIMLFSYAVRAVYVESCSMYVRGGVYKVVRLAMGGIMAKLSVSALLFDYVLTGPISGVAAGLYLGGMLNDLRIYFNLSPHVLPERSFAVITALIVTAYFWRKNILGVHESSRKALRIMQITTVMVVILAIWSLLTIYVQGYNPVPLPVLENIHFGENSLGWLKGTVAPGITCVAILVGLGHSLLAMSGEESLAQVNREIAHPKLKNLKKAGFVIFVYSIIFTTGVSFAAVMIIPDSVRPDYLENLIGGLAMHLVGPEYLRFLFYGFVVLVGAGILSGAVNTAIIGSNGVLNRVAEDGILADWFRYPHKKYGTSYRIINLIALLQMGTIVISQGDLYVLGEMYAFGVVWSFTMNALSMLILRYKQPEGREWKVPFNIHIGNIEIPVGLSLITISLLMLAIINLLTKQMATIYGTTFTVVFFIIFVLSERYNKSKAKTAALSEKFLLASTEDVNQELANVRPGNLLIPVANPHKLTHLKYILSMINPAKEQLVVLNVPRVSDTGAAEQAMTSDRIFSLYVSDVFSKVVEVAEKAGIHVELVVRPGSNPWAVIMRTAQELQSSRIIVGESAWMTNDELCRRFSAEWETLPKPHPPMKLEIVPAQAKYKTTLVVNIGPHPPRMWPEDVMLLHRLWLRSCAAIGEHGRALQHRDVISVALKLADRQLNDPQSPFSDLLRQEASKVNLNRKVSKAFRQTDYPQH